MIHNTITFGVAALSGYFAAKYSHKEGNSVITSAFYAVGAGLIGIAVSEGIQLRTGFKKAEGFNDLVAPISLVAGMAIVGITGVVTNITKD